MAQPLRNAGKSPCWGRWRAPASAPLPVFVVVVVMIRNFLVTTIITSSSRSSGEAPASQNPKPTALGERSCQPLEQVAGRQHTHTEHTTRPLSRVRWHWLRFVSYMCGHVASTTPKSSVMSRIGDNKHMFAER